MWPQLNQIGERGICPHEIKHDNFCHYLVLRKSFRQLPNRMIWSERCFHGHTKLIDSTFVVEGLESPTKTIKWYDPEGKLERITGDK